MAIAQINDCFDKTIHANNLIIVAKCTSRHKTHFRPSWEQLGLFAEMANVPHLAEKFSHCPFVAIINFGTESSAAASKQTIVYEIVTRVLAQFYGVEARLRERLSA